MVVRKDRGDDVMSRDENLNRNESKSEQNDHPSPTALWCH